jgi:hypothetical protein
MKTQSSLAALDSIIERIPSGNYASKEIRSEVSRIRNAIASLAAMNGSPNPLETSAAHTRKICAAAEKLSNQIEASRSKIQSFASSGMDGLHNAMVEKAGLRQNLYAAEVRTAFRGLDGTERIQFLNDLLETGDGASLAAVLDAPSTLTGISKDVREKYREVATQRAAPSEYAAFTEILETLDSGLTASSCAADAASAFADPARLAQIEADEAAATAASASFEATLSN